MGFLKTLKKNAAQATTGPCCTADVSNKDGLQKRTLPTEPVPTPVSSGANINTALYLKQQLMEILYQLVWTQILKAKKTSWENLKELINEGSQTNHKLLSLASL